MITLYSDFNPRSREGSDDKFRTVFLCPKLFQSTLPRRERPLPEDHFPDDAPISIHAPAKGATTPLFLLPPVLTHFNPRSREGSDKSEEELLNASLEFQSTLPRRERPSDILVKK